MLSSNLEMGVALNVIGHLSISVGAYADETIMGNKVLFDKTGIEHIGISKYPFVITKVKPNRLKRLIDEVKQEKNLLLVDYPKEMLLTGHDDELVSALLEIENTDIEYLGAVLYGDASLVSSFTGKFTLWK